MDYTEDLLNQITGYARDLTPIEEMAALLDLSETELRQDVNTLGHPARKAFLSGYSKTALELRRMNIDMVKTGSPAADDACRMYMKRMISDIES